jgi:hypothetical protein
LPALDTQGDEDPVGDILDRAFPVDNLQKTVLLIPVGEGVGLPVEDVQAILDDLLPVVVPLINFAPATVATPIRQRGAKAVW